jgi:hypothetical protein
MVKESLMEIHLGFQKPKEKEKVKVMQTGLQN